MGSHSYFQTSIAGTPKCSNCPRLHPEHNLLFGDLVTPEVSYFAANPKLVEADWPGGSGPAKNSSPLAAGAIRHPHRLIQYPKRPFIFADTCFIRFRSDAG